MTNHKHNQSEQKNTSKTTKTAKATKPKKTVKTTQELPKKKTTSELPPKKTKQTKKSRKANKAKIFVIIAAIVSILSIVAFVIVHFLTAEPTSNCHGMVGTWRYSGSDYSGDYILTFKDDGTGDYNQDGDTLNFVYSDLADTFDILYDGQDVFANFTYQISEDNNTFTMQDSLGEDVVYTCQ